MPGAPNAAPTTGPFVPWPTRLACGVPSTVRQSCAWPAKPTVAASAPSGDSRAPTKRGCASPGSCSGRATLPLPSASRIAVRVLALLRSASACSASAIARSRSRPIRLALHARPRRLVVAQLQGGAGQPVGVAERAELLGRLRLRQQHVGAPRLHEAVAQRGDAAQQRHGGDGGLGAMPSHPLGGARPRARRPRLHRFPVEEAPQIGLELGGRGVALRRVLLERLHAHGGEVARHLGVALVHRLGVDEADLVDDLLQVLAVERPAQRQQLVEDDAERPDVGAVVDLAPLGERLLGAHVVRRARDLAGDRQAALVERLGEAEVEQPHLAAVVDHQVARLQVAVHDAGLVRGGERRRELGGEQRALGDVALVRGDAERALDALAAVAVAQPQVVEDVGEVAAGDVVHRQRERAVDLGERVHRHDRRVPHLRRRRRLAAEALDVPLAERQAAGHDLERDAPVQRPLVREVDHAHAAAAELGLDDEVAERAAVGSGAGLVRRGGRPFLVADGAVEGEIGAQLGQ